MLIVWGDGDLQNQTMSGNDRNLGYGSHFMNVRIQGRTMSQTSTDKSVPDVHDSKSRTISSHGTAVGLGFLSILPRTSLATNLVSINNSHGPPKVESSQMPKGERDASSSSNKIGLQLTS